MLVEDDRVASRDALTRAGIKPLELAAKEGLISDTQYMTSIGALALHDAAMLTKIASSPIITWSRSA